MIYVIRWRDHFAGKSPKVNLPLPFGCGGDGFTWGQLDLFTESDTELAISQLQSAGEGALTG